MRTIHIALLLLLGVFGCSQSFGVTSHDGSRDADAPPPEDLVQTHEDVRLDRMPDRPDVFDRALPPRDVYDAGVVMDIVDVPGVVDSDSVQDVPEEMRPDIVDVAMERPDGPDCPRDPPSGPPLGVGRSCGDGGAPAWQCREVPYCGGRYTMGSTDAWEVYINPNPGMGTRVNLRMRTCDVHEAVVRGGYVDAYEVTVARFRAWVNAGMPRPANGEPYFSGLRWDDGFNEQLQVPTQATAEERVPGMTTSNAMCTWSPTPGVNDDLPINCLTVMSAFVFCWWDGKHIATEIAWEYLATNRGTTPTPFGMVLPDSRGCAYGDVGSGAGICPRRMLPSAVNTHPTGATRDPAGIHDLWGGVQEFVVGLNSPYAPVPCLTG